MSNYIIITPPTYYGSIAADAPALSDIDMGYVRAGDYQSYSLRLGNRGVSDLYLSTLIADANTLANWTISPNETTIPANGMSDTVTLMVETDISAPDAMHTATLIISGEHMAEITYEVVGSNSERRQQYPRRAGNQTDTFAGVIERLGQPITVHMYHPIAYARDDTTVIVRNGRPVTQSVCERLSPSNTRWGYTHQQITIVGVIGSEHWETRETYQQDDTTVSYSGSYRLTFPAVDELQRTWALFAPAKGADQHQYKRSVFIIKYEGRYFGLQNIRSADFGDELAAFSVDLIPLQTSDMGAPQYYNPFAMTYRYESDQPYAAYPCPCNLSISDAPVDASGSANPSAINSSF